MLGFQKKSPIYASIISRFATSILVKVTIKEIITDIMSRTQFSSLKQLNLHMHGLIFETSEWLLAGSTRLLLFYILFFKILKKNKQI